MQNVVGKNIRRIRKQKKMTQKQLSERTGFSQNGISNHESGNRKIDELDIMVYAEALGVKPHELFNAEAAEEEEPAIPSVPVISIPVVSQISAGMPIYAEENIVEHTYIADTITKEGKEYFGLKVSGDSMDKEFKEGDVVIIEKDSTVENGQIGVVMINGYNATLKRVKYFNDSILLMPESYNPKHEPQVYTNKDEIHIIGKVVGLSRRY